MSKFSFFKGDLIDVEPMMGLDVHMSSIDPAHIQGQDELVAPERDPIFTMVRRELMDWIDVYDSPLLHLIGRPWLSTSLSRAPGVSDSPEPGDSNVVRITSHPDHIRLITSLGKGMGLGTIRRRLNSMEDLPVVAVFGRHFFPISRPIITSSCLGLFKKRLVLSTWTPYQAETIDNYRIESRPW